MCVIVIVLSFCTLPQNTTITTDEHEKLMMMMMMMFSCKIQKDISINFRVNYSSFLLLIALLIKLIKINLPDLILLTNG